MENKILNVVISSPRRGGKTTKAIELMRENTDWILVVNTRNAINNYPHDLHDRIRTVNQLIGYGNKKLFVEDANTIDAERFAPARVANIVVGISITPRNWIQEYMSNAMRVKLEHE